MAKRHERSFARRMAVQMLYRCDVTGTDIADALSSGEVIPDEGVPPEYACTLLRGVADNVDELDRIIASASQNWKPERMPIVDRAILRMAVYEIRFIDVVPVSVSINEAVELAKDFGGEDESARFVNGILGGIVNKDDADGNVG